MIDEIIEEVSSLISKIEEELESEALDKGQMIYHGAMESERKIEVYAILFKTKIGKVCPNFLIDKLEEMRFLVLEKYNSNDNILNISEIETVKEGGGKFYIELSN